MRRQIVPLRRSELLRWKRGVIIQNNSPFISLYAGLQAFYRFNEGGGTSTADSSGNGWTISLAGSLTGAWNNSGQVGPYCLTFNGTLYGTTISGGFANFEKTQPRTLSFWLYGPVTTTSSGIILAHVAYGGAGWLVGFTGSGKLFHQETDGTNANQWTTSSFICSNNAWHNIVVTDDGSENAGAVVFYTDTVVQGQTTSIPGITSSLVVTPFSIGALNNGLLPLPNLIRLDAMGLWNRVLTTAEIALLYNGGVGVEL